MLRIISSTLLYSIYLSQNNKDEYNYYKSLNGNIINFFSPYLNYLMKRFYIYKTKIISYISVNKNFAYIPFLKFLKFLHSITFGDCREENKCKSWYAKITIEAYLLNYERLKFALDRARQRYNEVSGETEIELFI